MVTWIFVLIPFLCLVIVGVKYDKIIPLITNIVRIRKIKIWDIIFGLVFIFVGILSLNEEPGFKNFAPGIENSERWGFPVHNRLFSAVIFIIGLLFIMKCFVKKKDFDSTSFDRICISCGAITKEADHNYVVCKDCGGKVESIDGVLERHPTLIESIKQKS